MNLSWMLAQDAPPIDITVTTPVGLPEWISVGLTLALVIVTAVYVKHTANMVKEMKQQREADVAHRRREKSDRAAYRCLEIVRNLVDEMNARRATAVSTEQLKITERALRGEGPLINQEDLRSRVAACAEVLHVGAFPNHQMDLEGLSSHHVALGVSEILSATRKVLENYLSERPMDDALWNRVDTDGCGDRLPDAGSAASWIRCVGSDTD